MNKLVEFVENYKKSNPTGWRKWVFGALATIAVVVLVAIFAIQAAQRGREMAALKHAEDAAQEALHKAQVNAKLAQNAEEQERHEAAAEAALDRSMELAAEIDRLAAQHRTNEEVLNNIRSWDDVDRVVK